VVSGIWLFYCVLGYNRFVVVCGNLWVFGFGFEFERIIWLFDLAVFCGMFGGFLGLCGVWGWYNTDFLLFWVVLGVLWVLVGFCGFSGRACFCLF